MSVLALTQAKTEFLQKYSTQDLYSRIFTNYKNYPSELTKVADLEVLARTKVSQISNLLGIRPTTVGDLFADINALQQEQITIALAAALPPDVPEGDLGGGDSRPDTGSGGG
jgi:hypothetical protein